MKDKLLGQSRGIAPNKFFNLIFSKVDHETENARS